MFYRKKVSKGYRVLRKRKGLKDTLKKRLDSEWSLKVKELSGFKCEYCGSTTGLQSHHIHTRSNKSVRWNTDNGVCLCSGHHKFYAHQKPHDFRDWITSVRGQEWWDKLTIMKNIK